MGINQLQADKNTNAKIARIFNDGSQVLRLKNQSTTLVRHLNRAA